MGSLAMIKQILMFAVISGLIWSMPTNLILFIPVVIFWVVLSAWLTVFFLSLINEAMED